MIDYFNNRPFQYVLYNTDSSYLCVRGKELIYQVPLGRKGLGILTPRLLDSHPSYFTTPCFIRIRSSGQDDGGLGLLGGEQLCSSRERGLILWVRAKGKSAPGQIRCDATLGL